MTARAGPVHAGRGTAGPEPGGPPYPYPESFSSRDARARMWVMMSMPSSPPSRATGSS